MKAANEMPAETSEFDRGLAAGLALARFVEKTDDPGKIAEKF